ncbi:hypothetical protein MMC25_007926 [Agyrium rufum]|nr:hypothetical protein [Agyrium rufum]
MATSHSTSENLASSSLRIPFTGEDDRQLKSTLTKLASQAFSSTSSSLCQRDPPVFLFTKGLCPQEYGYWDDQDHRWIDSRSVFIRAWVKQWLHHATGLIGGLEDPIVQAIIAKHVETVLDEDVCLESQNPLEAISPGSANFPLSEEVRASKSSPSLYLSSALSSSSSSQKQRAPPSSFSSSSSSRDLTLVPQTVKNLSISVLQSTLHTDFGLEITGATKAHLITTLQAAYLDRIDPFQKTLIEKMSKMELYRHIDRHSLLDNEDDEEEENVHSTALEIVKAQLYNVAYEQPCVRAVKRLMDILRNQEQNHDVKKIKPDRRVSPRKTKKKKKQPLINFGLITPESSPGVASASTSRNQSKTKQKKKKVSFALDLNHDNPTNSEEKTPARPRLTGGGTSFALRSPLTPSTSPSERYSKVKNRRGRFSDRPTFGQRSILKRDDNQPAASIIDKIIAEAEEDGTVTASGMTGFEEEEEEEEDDDDDGEAAYWQKLKEMKIRIRERKLRARRGSAGGRGAVGHRLIDGDSDTDEEYVPPAKRARRR